MLEYIYICRHGFRSNWVDPSIKTGPTGMNRDPPLAAYGLTQANQLAKFLSNPTPAPASESSNASNSTPPKPQRVFSSPFYRCIETSLPTARALGVEVELEHGVQEWYSPTNPDTGLHPRPSSPTTLSPLFPSGSINTNYTSTVYPSRHGETLSGLQDRADLFVEAWTSRVEGESGGEDIKCVVVFGHAASVIALGRALTGDKSLNVPAGCASSSLYRRKAAQQPSATQFDDKSIPCGVGEWDAVWLGRADYLENGLERDWSYRDVVIVDGEVVNDDGDHGPHKPEEELPEGLAEGMERYLRRGRPKGNDQILEVLQAGSEGPGARM